MSFRVAMGLRPTHRDESQAFVTPAQAGVHVDRTNWIPAFAGMTRLSTEPSPAERSEPAAAGRSGLFCRATTGRSRCGGTARRHQRDRAGATRCPFVDFWPYSLL